MNTYQEDEESSSNLYSQPYSSQQQQQLLIETDTLNSAENLQYYAQRGESIQEIERTITQLSELFKKLRGLVHSQTELVQRIDDNVTEAEEHFQLSMDVLTKGLADLNSNRPVMMKVGAVLFLFMLLFVIFFL